MNLIQEIENRLSKYSGVRYKATTSSITVFQNAPDGFSVGLEVNPGNKYTISFDGWHEDFEDQEEALNVFGLGLSDECRLKEYRRGAFRYKWTLESLEDGEWTEQSTTALLLFPFWKKASVRYLQNKVLTQTARTE
jgi:hypothetical protein